MRQVSVFDAKTHFSALINNVIRSGDPVEITRHGQPVVKILPSEHKNKLDVNAAFDLIDELREANQRATQEEIKRWKEEGRA